MALQLPHSELTILKLTAAGGLWYGLRIIQEAQGQIALGSVYTLLRRMEKKGYLQSQLEDKPAHIPGQPRRLYTITAFGKKALNLHESFVFPNKDTDTKCAQETKKEGPTENVVNELKACPFCLLDESQVQVAREGESQFIQCRECGAQGPSFHPGGGGDAVELWNQRFLHGWVKCDERTPSKSSEMDLLVVTDRDRMLVARWAYHCFSGNVLEDGEYITHWLDVELQLPRK